ncbi:MAG: hypothetical protein FWC66_00765, partial [Oscillospiraceae bacterium]|nr:hypothetical protein [Oscillospiraceae bacterium]
MKMKKQGLRKLLAIIVVITMMTSSAFPAMAVEVQPPLAESAVLEIEALSTPEVGDFRFNKFNAEGTGAGANLDLYNGGTIRLWSQIFAYGSRPAHIGGTGYRWANESIITELESATLNDGRCAIELGLIRLVNANQISVAFGRSLPANTLAIGDRAAQGITSFPWEEMTLVVLIDGFEPQSVTLINHFHELCDCDFLICCDECQWRVCSFCDLCGRCVHCEECVCALAGRITFNFPGMENMIVQYWTGTWQTLAGGPFDDSVAFDALGATVVRALRDGLVYSREITADGVYVIDAPVIQLYVRGVPVAGNTLGVVGGGFGSNWVDNGVIACEVDGNAFTVFNNRAYEVRLSRTGFFPLSRMTSEGYDDGYEYLYVDLSAYFDYITVPQGVSNVRMQSNGWIVNAAQESDVIWLLIDYPNFRDAVVTFDYCCLVQHRVEFSLNGDNPLFAVCDCCDANSGFPCNLCPDCGACEDCSVCLDFRFDIFNNGPGGSTSRPNPGLASSGTIRLWPGFGTTADGNNRPLSLSGAAATVEAVDQEGNCVMDDFVSINQMWVAGEGWVDRFNFIDVNKNAPWQTITLTITVCGEEHSVLLVNSRFLSFDIYNNGPRGCPSRPHAGHAANGIIRMWTQLGGTNMRIPFAFASTIEATVRETGACARDFLIISRMWVDGTGWVEYLNRIDVVKDSAWEFIDLEITVFGQTLHVVLHNGDFKVCNPCPDCGECQDCSACPEFGFGIFNNGPGGAPSTANPGLAASGTIRMWPQFDGVGTNIPLAVADTIVALDQDFGNAMQFVTVNRQWVDGTGWADYFVNIDVNKNAPWQTITLTITVCGEDYEILLVNSRYFSLHIFNNGPGGAQYPRPNESLQNAGLIRMWTRLMDVDADVPYTAMTAVDQDGNVAMQFIRVNYVDGLVRSIDARKYMPWETITFSMTVYGQTVTVLLVNDLFPGWFGLNIFNNGPEGSPSTPNASLAAGGTIRMWTQFDGVNTPIPRSATSTMVATNRDTGACALHLILLRPITGDEITMIDVNRNAPWEFIDFSIVVFNQRLEVVLHNPDDNGGGEPCECDVCDICDGCLDENCDCDECTPCDCPVVGTCDCDLCDICDGCLDENCDCDECTPCDCPVVGTCDCDLCDVCDGCLDENCD